MASSREALDRDDGEPVIQILPKVSDRDQIWQYGVRRGYYSYVDLLVT